MNFKFTKKKFWIVFVISFIIGIVGSSLGSPIYQTTPFERFLLMLFPFGLISFVITFGIIYVIWSLFQKKK